MNYIRSNSASINEHPRLGGTPIARLAGQCNKLASKSPSPLADTTVGKDFQSWKKGAAPSPAGQRPLVSVNCPQPTSCLDAAYQRPVTSSACGVPETDDGENIFCAPPPPPQSDSQGLISKVDTNSASHLDAVYSRVITHPYESWPFTMNALIKTEVASTTAPSGLEVVGPGSAATWLGMFGAAPTLHNYFMYYSHLQHLHLQDTYKSMLSGQGGGVPVAALAGPLSPQLPSPRVQRRYPDCATCDCLKCAEAERLGLAGGHIKKKKIHSCHIPGCGKVYGKASVLRAHLRRHTGERSFVCNFLFCGKRFIRSDELKRHWRTHAAEKRLACHVCSKRFVRSDHLSRHVKTHNGTGDGKNTGFSSVPCFDYQNSQSEYPVLSSPSSRSSDGPLVQLEHPEVTTK